MFLHLCYTLSFTVNHQNYLPTQLNNTEKTVIRDIIVLFSKKDKQRIITIQFKAKYKKQKNHACANKYNIFLG